MITALIVLIWSHIPPLKEEPAGLPGFLIALIMAFTFFMGIRIDLATLHLIQKFL